MLTKLKIFWSPKPVTFLDERIDFDLLFEDTNKLNWTLIKEKRDGIKYPLNKYIKKIDVLEMNMHGKNSKNTIGKFKTNYADYFS